MRNRLVRRQEGVWMNDSADQYQQMQRDTSPLHPAANKERVSTVQAIDTIKSGAPYAMYLTARLMTLRHTTLVRGSGVHAAESFILLELWRDGALSQKELSQRLNINHASTGQTLRRLESSGLVERWKSPDDGRVMMARTTAKADELQSLVITAGLQQTFDFESSLNDQDLVEFKRMLALISAKYLPRD